MEVVIISTVFWSVMLGVTIYAMVKNFGAKGLPESIAPPVLPVTFASNRSLVAPFAS